MDRFGTLGRVGALAGTLALAGAGLLGIATPAGATTVSTEAQLRAAFGNPAETQIDLANSITLTDCTDATNFGEVNRTAPTAALEVDGHGFTVTQTCPTAGVFGQNGDFLLTFQNITITGGHADNTTTCYGGGIRTSSPVTVINSTIRDNFAACSGGGISVGSSLEIDSSTISGNTTDGEGGGIFQSSGGQPFSMTNSTVFNNTANTDNGLPGGGVRAFGDLELTYSTIVANTAVDGANLSGYDGGPASLTLFGSVIAFPDGGGPNCSGFGTPTSNGYNWDDDGTCGLGAGPGDHSDAGDPQLFEPTNNGGPTETLLPRPGSGLIDQIPATSPCAGVDIVVDQRGLPRPTTLGEFCDIGAVEVQPAEAVPATVVTVEPTFTG